VAGDGRVDLRAGHALADIRVLRDRLEGHVRHALIDEAAAHVVRRPLHRQRARVPGDLGLLAHAGLGVGEQVVRVLGRHQARAREGEGDAAGVDRDPAATPLLGDVGGGAGAAGRVQHEVTGVRGHEKAALNDLRRCLHRVDLALAAGAGVGPDVRQFNCREVVNVCLIAKSST